MPRAPDHLPECFRPDRLVPGIPFPAYAYVPCLHPHPTRDAGGHSHGKGGTRVVPLSEAGWQTNPEYLYGFDLFNHGYYWEAHEAWESLWHAAGRQGPIADWLKGLIKLAAAGVKGRQGGVRGVRRSLVRSVELLSVPRCAGFRLGFDPGEIVRRISESLQSPEEWIDHAQEGGIPMAPWTLMPKP